MPISAKIRLIIRHVPGVQEVHYQQTEGGQPLTLTAIQSATAVPNSVCSGGLCPPNRWWRERSKPNVWNMPAQPRLWNIPVFAHLRRS
jgi:hypothetical protein